MLLLRMASRNLLRNRRRSAITLVAISFGLGAIIFLRGFIFGVQRQMVRNIVSTITNEAQIFPASLENLYNTNGFIDDPEAVRQILRREPGIAAYAEEIYGAGIVSTPSGSVMSFVTGVDLEEEKAIGTVIPMVHGRLLAETDDQGALLGEKMLKILDVGPGDKIVVTVQNSRGELSGEAFTLIGTFETGNDQLDNGNVVLLRRTAQRLLALEGKVSKFALKIDPRYRISDVVANLRQKVTGSGIKVMTWEELIPMLAQILRFQNGMTLVVLLIVLTVVTAGILNTLLMSIIERVREFGLMMALGTSPGRVILLVVSESFLLTAFGTVIGIGLGLVLTTYFGYVGIDLSRFLSTFSNLLVGSHVYPTVDWVYLSIFVSVILGANLLVSFYPAWRAGRLVPVDAMRQVG